MENEKKSGRGPARKMRHLLFDVGGDQVECWHFLGDQFEHHHWLNDEKLSREALISRHVRQIQSDRQMREELFLEFFVAIDGPDDMHDFDRWSHLGSSLGCFHPVVVRWRDRTVSRRAVGQNVWEAKCDLIKDRSSLDQPPVICWLPDEKYPAQQRVRKLSRADDYDCVGLATPPVGKQVEAEAKGILRDVLESGVPFAFWPRLRPPDGQEFTDGFNRHFSACCKAVTRLPAHVQSLREEVAGDAQHLHANITLLWDDAARNPVNCEDGQFGLPE